MYDEFDQSRHDDESVQEPLTATRNPLPLDTLVSAFRAQLLALLGECSAGRIGLFGSGIAAKPWPEAEQLRQLAQALESLLAQQAHASDFEAKPDPNLTLVQQFLDLCSIHGESDPGEPRLARAFLSEIAKDA